MTERPFAYDKAFANMKTNFIYNDGIAKILFKLIKLKVGGKI